MSFFEDIGIFFSKAWDFVRPLVKVFLTEAGHVLADSALEAVKATAANLTGASSTEKRDAAYKLILADLQAKGIQMSGSMINAAIEAAVQKMKE